MYYFIWRLSWCEGGFQENLVKRYALSSGRRGENFEILEKFLEQVLKNIWLASSKYLIRWGRQSFQFVSTIPDKDYQWNLQFSGGFFAFRPNNSREQVLTSVL